MNIPVPDGNFSLDTPNYYINGNNGGGLTFTSPMTATLADWSISASPSTANGGLYSDWEPYGAVDSVSAGNSVAPFNNNAPWVGSQPTSSYQAFMYYPGELGSVATGAQPVANLTMVTTGISEAAATGDTYAATIQYANVSWSNCADNNSANVELDIQANGVTVGSAPFRGWLKTRHGRL